MEVLLPLGSLEDEQRTQHSGSDCGVADCARVNNAINEIIIIVGRLQQRTNNKYALGEDRADHMRDAFDSIANFGGLSANAEIFIIADDRFVTRAAGACVFFTNCYRLFHSARFNEGKRIELPLWDRFEIPSRAQFVIYL